MALTDKILVLGVDGMDPRLAKYFMDKGKMPNLKKYVEQGASREDLVLLGAHPTVTPPLWTTLATGAYPMTHGITDYHMQSKESLDTIYYSFDSRLCKAELLWNIFAEAGKKTLVFHWPGSSWPPTSDSPNLHVVDGLSPGAIGMTCGCADTETIIVADESLTKITYQKNVKLNAVGAGCIIEGLDVGSETHDMEATQANVVTNIMLDHMHGDAAVEEIQMDFVNSPIKPAEGWANAPEGAKEFTLVANNNMVRRPVLLLKNEDGIYDTVEIYDKKKEHLLCSIKVGDYKNYIDKGFFRGEKECLINYGIGFIECKPDGSYVKLYMSKSMSTEITEVFHPQSLHEQIIKSAGHVPGMPTVGGCRADLVEGALLPCWENYTKWQNKAMKTLIDENDYDVIFSHVHNVDICAHVFYRLSIYRKHNPEIELEKYPGFMERLYVDVDRYLGEFMEYLDKGYTIFIVSDHGGVIPTAELPPLLGDPLGVNAGLMYELGYTGLKKDENGNLLREVDWSTTKAIATRECYIWLNLIGRNGGRGIVDPKDQYELERQIIDDLYNYRDPETGERVVSLALRRKDAVHFGLDSDECGDIIYFIEEGHNHAHGDGLSTVQGPLHTSVSPIFVACGKGIKPGYTSRVIRQVDFAPTLATMTGVRMPAQCEGAPIYQILDADVKMC